MLQVSGWVRILVAIILIGGILIALPNALPPNVRAHLPGWMQDTVNLGLDLQGGSYVLLEVELDQVQKDQLDSTVGDIRRALRKEHIGYKDLQTTGDSVGVTVIDHAQFDDAVSQIKNLNPALSGTMLVGQRQYDITQPGGDHILLKMTDAYKKQLQTDVVGRSIEVVRKRIDELGTKEPSIEQQGNDRIVVQVPGLSDPTHLLKILQTTAKMTFQMVDESGDVSLRSTSTSCPSATSCWSRKKRRTAWRSRRCWWRSAC